MNAKFSTFVFFLRSYRGATHSKAVICDKFGSIISKVTGPSTNHWVSGIPEVARRIAAMIESAKTQANISQNVKLQSLGLSLSGCEQVNIGFSFSSSFDNDNRVEQAEILIIFEIIVSTGFHKQSLGTGIVNEIPTYFGNLLRLQ